MGWNVELHERVVEEPHLVLEILDEADIGAYNKWALYDT